MLLGHAELGWEKDAPLNLTRILPEGLEWFQHNDFDDNMGRIQNAVRRCQAEVAVVQYYVAKKWKWRKYWPVRGN